MKKKREEEKVRPPKVGELVLVEHGSSTRGQVAVVSGVDAPGLVKVRKFHPRSGSFAAETSVPLWKTRGKPERGDKRAAAARALLAEETQAAEKKAERAAKKAAVKP